MTLVATDAPARSRALGLTGICLGFLMITLDATIVNVALGPIGADLGGALSTAQWIVNGYTLPFAALLLSAGALADRAGARTGFLIGLAVFALGSAACAGAASLTVLIAARVVQGAGAAALMPCSLALIAHGFPEAHARRRALGLWGGASGIGLAAGPVLGGVLIAASGWRAIFLVNLPIAAAAAWLLVRHVGETGRHRQPLDVPGQLLAMAGLASLTGGFIATGSQGWEAPRTLALLVAGVASAGAFVAVERAVAHPMVDPRLFRERTLATAVEIGAVFNFCLYGAIFCLAIHLHQARGFDALHTGLALLPMTVVTGTMAFLSGRLVSRVGEWRAIAAGLAAGAVGALLISLEGPGVSAQALVASSVLLGVSALAMPAMTALALSRAPRDRVGLTSGVFNASRQTGGALGVAVLGALLASGGGSVSLRAAFAVAAAAYATGVALALRGLTRTPVPVPGVSTGTTSGPSQEHETTLPYQSERASCASQHSPPSWR
jgi:DHA2 family methylenomycin A resistance protein-like MFS transporter